MPSAFAQSFRSPPGRSGSRCLRFEALEQRVVLSGSGLTGQYFHNADFTGLGLERVEAVNLFWAAAPAPGIGADSFSVRWTGQVEAEFSETYTFRTISDDGVRLWVDGQLLVDNWTIHSAVLNSGTIALTAGQRYDVRLEYYDGVGSAQIRLQWQSPSKPLEAVPAAQLYGSPLGVLGEYSDAFGGVGTRVDAGIDFNWGASRPISTVAVDSFRVRWTGLVRPEHSELYTFSTLSDEGVRVWVGDELIIDHWSSHTAATATGAKTLEAGKWYDLRVEYFDASGDAEVALSWSSASQTGDQLEIIGGDNLRATKHTPLIVPNPLGEGADPFVVHWNNSYLLVRSYTPGSAEQGVWIDQADQLQDVHVFDPDSTTVKAWTPPAGTNYSEQIWAPELHQIGGKWYIYVAASGGSNETHRMHVLERDDPNPMGPFTYKGLIAAPGNRWAIDGTVLQWQDQLYFVWSGWPGATDGQQNLYIAPMSNPWTISGARVLLSSPTFAWEQFGLPINEGPEILINDGQLHIIYSGSGYWRAEYALGRLTFDGTGSVLDPANWTKAPAPVFQQAGQIVGTGHASFTKSPDGTQDWIVYHSHPSPGGNPDARVVRIQPFTYNADGTPNFGPPIQAGTKIEAPSGYADADRPLLPGDFDASGAVGAPDLGVWAAQFGGEIFPGRSMEGADFLTWQRQLGATASAAYLADASLATSASSALSSAEQSIDAAAADVAFFDLRGLSGMPLGEFGEWRGAWRRGALDSVRGLRR